MAMVNLLKTLAENLDPKQEKQGFQLLNIECRCNPFGCLKIRNNFRVHFTAQARTICFAKSAQGKRRAIREKRS